MVDGDRDGGGCRKAAIWAKGRWVVIWVEKTGMRCSEQSQQREGWWCLDDDGEILSSF